MTNTENNTPAVADQAGDNSVKQNKIDGLKLEFENEWVHMRKSNTEPIIRIYAESENEKSAHELGERFVEELKSGEMISFKLLLGLFVRCVNPKSVKLSNVGFTIELKFRN